MKGIFFVICAFFCAGMSATAGDMPQIPDKGSKLENFVPKPYEILNQKEADFNGDGTADTVMVIGLKDKEQEGDRFLLVLFRQKDGTYQLSVKTEKAILCSECGGIAGEPFMGIEIKKNTFIISHHGGSSIRWDYKHQFRFQDGDWYLIGQTVAEIGTGRPLDCPELKLKEPEMCTYHGTDTNFLTGSEIEKWQISRENGDEKTKELSRKVPKKSLRKLSEFSIEP